MKVVISRHVKEKIGERHINEEQIVACAKKPDFILPADEGRKVYLKDMGKNYLKAIIAEGEKELVVVTVYWIAKNRLKRYNSN